MTEVLTQAYALDGHHHIFPFWSRAMVRDNAVGPWQKAQAHKVGSWSKMSSTLLDSTAPRDHLVAPTARPLLQNHRAPPEHHVDACGGPSGPPQAVPKLKISAFIHRSGAAAATAMDTRWSPNASGKTG